MKEIVITVDISRDGDGRHPYVSCEIGNLVNFTGRYRFDSYGDMHVEVQAPKVRVTGFGRVLFTWGTRCEWVNEDDVKFSEIFVCTNS